MPLVRWEFSVSGKRGIQGNWKLEPHSIGIDAASPEEVEELAVISGFEASGWDRDGAKYRKIDVNEPEGSERLKKLLAAIKDKYRFVPSEHRIVPVGDRAHVFGLGKLREYTSEELDEPKFVCIDYVDKIIAEHKDGTPEQIEAEQYVVEPHRKKKTVRLGILMPSHQMAVSGELKDQLEDAGLEGVEFESGAFPKLDYGK